MLFIDWWFLDRSQIPSFCLNLECDKRTCEIKIKMKIKNMDDFWVIFRWFRRQLSSQSFNNCIQMSSFHQVLLLVNHKCRHKHRHKRWPKRQLRRQYKCWHKHQRHHHLSQIVSHSSILCHFINAILMKIDSKER